MAAVGQDIGGRQVEALEDRATGALLGAAAGEAFGSPAGPDGAGRWGALTDAALDALRADADTPSGTTADRLTGAWSRLGPLAATPGGRAVLLGAVAAAVACRHRADLALPEAGGPTAVETAVRAGADAETAEACTLWAAATLHALGSGRMDPRAGLPALGADRAELWAQRLAEAEAKPPAEFCRGEEGVVQLVQAAWSAVHDTPVPADQPRSGIFRVQHLQTALLAAAEAGGAPVAAVAGTLLGAAYGATAVPAAWRRRLHGAGGASVRDLTGARTAGAAGADYSLSGDLSAIGQHPHDQQVWIGGYKALRNPPPGVDAIVSLCPVAPADIPAGLEQVDVRLADSPRPQDNPNLAFVLHDTADLVQALRAEGRTVLVHGVRAQSRVPAAACAYAFRCYRLPAGPALADIERVLLGARVNDGFREALTALAPVVEAPPVQNRGGGRLGRTPRGYRGPGDWPEGRSVRGRR